MKIPFLFMRIRKCTPENGLVPNTSNGKHCLFVVKLTRHSDYKFYNSSWMDDPILGEGKTDDDAVFVPDVDITEQTFVFDGPDASVEEQKAYAKMKELWAEVSLDS